MPAHPFLLTGRIALVTGASRGLGLEIALGLARAGAHVLVNSRDGGRCDAVAARIAGEGGSAAGLPFDVADEAAVEANFGHVGKQFGRLDILVHNVGMRHRAALHQITKADFERMTAVDLISAFTIGKLAGKLMMTKGYGRIIFVTSIAGTLGYRGMPLRCGAQRLHGSRPVARKYMNTRIDGGTEYSHCAAPVDQTGRPIVAAVRHPLREGHVA